MIINSPKKKKIFSRYNVFIILVALVFSVIIAKLAYLQLYKHDDYREKANTTSTRFMSEVAPRGIIYDQNGNLLATNSQTYALTYTSTTDADKYIYRTIDSVLKILDDNGDSSKVQDDLALKLDENNNWYIQFTTNDPDAQRVQEIRFKRDIGLNDEIQNELKKQGIIAEDTTDYSDQEIEMVDKKLMEISPEEVFEYLVKSFSMYDLLIDQTQNKDQIAEEQKKYKKMDASDIAQLVKEKYTNEQLRNYMVIKYAIKMQSFKGFKSVTIAKNITFNTASVIYQKLSELYGIDVTQQPIRNYPYKSMASQVLGYLSPIDATNSSNYELRGYDVSTDLIGVSGIESSFEEQLKGVKGGTTVKVNSKGQVTSELFKLESYPGNNVHLTIDKNLQYAAEQSLKDTMEGLRTGAIAGTPYPGATRGAVVAVEVNTGRILASASYPDYDPNIFAVSGQLTDEQNQEYFNPDLEKFGTEYIKSRGLSLSLDDLFPLDSNGKRSDKRDVYPRAFYNYVTQGLIPPGSAFKPMTAIAGLEEGVITPQTPIYCTGVFNTHPEVLNSFAPKCLSAHGAITLDTALEKSCNMFFYEVGFQLYMNGGQNVEALDSLAQYAWKFGLGADPNGQQKNSTGIEIKENFGQVYNFTSARNQAKYYARFDLANYLEQGNYEGRTYYVPFDYSASEDDDEDLKNAKASLKKKISDRIDKFGTKGENATDHDSFAKSILGDVQDIMNYSRKYADNVTKYQTEKNTTVDRTNQAQIIADVIATFVINDRRSELTSPAQEIYAAIGQGMNAFSPIQIAQYVSTIANGGTRYALHYVDKITSPDGNTLQEFGKTVLDETGVSKQTLDAVKAGMRKVNMDENGTAVGAFENFPIETAGKTGTADINDQEQESWGRAPFATYITFAPYDKPEIAIVAVVYDGGHGGYIAPIAKAIYEAYFKDRLLSIDPNYASKSQSFQKYILNAPQDNKNN